MIAKRPQPGLSHNEGHAISKATARVKRPLTRGEIRDLVSWRRSRRLWGESTLTLIQTAWVLDRDRAFVVRLIRNESIYGWKRDTMKPDGEVIAVWAIDTASVVTYLEQTIQFPSVKRLLGLRPDFNLGITAWTYSRPTDVA